jgi:hypothetical protein
MKEFKEFQAAKSKEKQGIQRESKQSQDCLFTGASRIYGRADYRMPLAFAK